MFRFGIVADPQYAPVAPEGTRHYGKSLWKLDDAVKFFNRHEDLQFVVTLGDFIDRHWQSFDDILPIYDRLKAPNFAVLGNHDFNVAGEHLKSVIGRVGLTQSYYDFKGGDYRFIVIHGNEISLFANEPGSDKHKLAESTIAAMRANGAPNAQEWNGGLSDTQYGWLRSTMDCAQAAGEKIIVFGHYPVYPFTDHSMWEHDRFLELVTGYSAFVAYFNGHDHAGNYGEFKGKHFLNFKGMVETATETACAVVEIHADRIDVVGQGREPSRSLRIRAQGLPIDE
jgi:predicted phosphodiesterase